MNLFLITIVSQWKLHAISVHYHAIVEKNWPDTEHGICVFCMVHLLNKTLNKIFKKISWNTFDRWFSSWKNSLKKPALPESLPRRKASTSRPLNSYYRERPGKHYTVSNTLLKLHRTIPGHCMKQESACRILDGMKKRASSIPGHFRRQVIAFVRLAGMKNRWDGTGWRFAGMRRPANIFNRNLRRTRFMNVHTRRKSRIIQRCTLMTLKCIDFL